jgi:hypothetical protein
VQLLHARADHREIVGGVGAGHGSSLLLCCEPGSSSGAQIGLIVSTKYRCHRFCHLQMSLGAGAEPRRSAASDRRPMRRVRNHTGCFAGRAPARPARRKVQPTLNRRASR